MWNINKNKPEQYIETKTQPNMKIKNPKKIRKKSIQILFENVSIFL